jgi:hypothetical protein
MQQETDHRNVRFGNAFYLRPVAKGAKNYLGLYTASCRRRTPRVSDGAGVGIRLGSRYAAGEKSLVRDGVVP